jgi:hypothetical protein
MRLDNPQGTQVSMAKKKTPEAPAPRGRPSNFTPAIAQEICERLSTGEPLAQICRDEHMPQYRTVSDWKAAHSEFAAQFARAREDGFDAIAEDCLKIADQTENDTVSTEHGDRPNTEWISRSKLRVETRLKLLAKWDPKRYGEKLAIGGASDLPPIQTMPDDDLSAKIAALMAKNNGSAE